jgi:hypothetical protein
MRAILTVAGLSLLAAPALAEDVRIELTIPRLDVAEYHQALRRRLDRGA